MALNKEFFDSIHIDIVKKKYYNANKVETLLAEIRSQAEALEEENARMRSELNSFTERKLDIGEAVISAQSIYNDMIKKANAEADEIIREARIRAAELTGSAMEMQDYAVKRAESFFSGVKERYMEAIEAVNEEWQDFLCGLIDSPPQEAEKTPPASEEEKIPLHPRKEEKTASSPAGEEALPPTLEESLSRIADAIAEINAET